jgi:hypothetical protein
MRGRGRQTMRRKGRGICGWVCWIARGGALHVWIDGSAVFAAVAEKQQEHVCMSRREQRMKLCTHVLSSVSFVEGLAVGEIVGSGCSDVHEAEHLLQGI